MHDVILKYIRNKYWLNSLCNYLVSLWDVCVWCVFILLIVSIIFKTVNIEDNVVILQLCLHFLFRVSIDLIGCFHRA